MVKKFFLLVFLLLIIYGIFSFIKIMGPKIRYAALLDQTKSIVEFTSTDTDDIIIRKLREFARGNGTPLTNEDIQLSRFNDELTIYISYSDSAVLPLGLKTLYYDQEIEVSEEDIE